MIVNYAGHALQTQRAARHPYLLVYVVNVGTRLTEIPQFFAILRKLHCSDQKVAGITESAIT